MLRYEVKLSDDNFKKERLVWREKYLAPDLSVVTGVTSPSYHLEKFDMLAATNSIINSDATLFVETENVLRQGFVVLKDKKYNVIEDSTISYSSNKSGETISYKYLNINGKYFYWGYIPGTINVNTQAPFSGYSIDNLLNFNCGKVVENIDIVCDSTANTVSVDTVYWIENGIVTIDGNEYIYDRNEGENGILKYRENGKALSESDITDCSSIEFYPYESSNDYEEVTKFKLTKNEEVAKDVEGITCCKHFFYVNYKGYNCEVKKKFNEIDEDTKKYYFTCEIPAFLLSGGTKEENLKTSDYHLYFALDGNDYETLMAFYNSGKKIDEDHYNEHHVKIFNELKNVYAFIYVEEDNAFFTVENDVLNANDGNEIIVHLKDEHTPLNVGNKIKFIRSSVDGYALKVYNAKDYGGKDDFLYVIYNGKKYEVEANICDRVVINGVEHNIDYVNGKEIGKDCLVSINEEQVPMKIVEENKLQRYGKIVVSGSSNNENDFTEDFKRVVDVCYNINEYSGVTINGKKYAAINDDDLYYVSVDFPSQYNFIIEEIMGSSMYICYPDINNNDFTEDFKRYESNLMCEDLVGNQNLFNLFIQNKIFGETEISKDLAFRSNVQPVSSDDFYNLFNDLTIYVNSSYINVPISFKINTAINGLSDDAASKNFYEAEKKKAINPIVDMEKDVYLPKFIENSDTNEEGIVEKYLGAKTTFKPIHEINLNFHFRTRNLDSWKVNDGYNNVKYCADKKITESESSTYLEDGSNDNWFITDFYPYRDILNSASTRTASADTLQSTSDLMGLLYFTNQDIFYQKSKVSKSFARLSFYDSTDPQTQSLLATSCIYIDGHSLFKKYIDNSRKNINEYGGVAEPEYSANTSGFIDPSPVYSGDVETFNDDKKKDITTLHKYNKISVMTEYLDKKKKNKSYSAISNSTNIQIDENHRISSRLTVNNKYLTKTSSEGFYLYIFREYTENLHPKPIYMKVEFNHAGIGKQIPFLIPMHWSGDDNKVYPISALTLSNTNDLAELKKGFPLSYIYAQTYIPLYAVYDFKNKEYAYVFDSRYVKQDSNGVLNLNLFEMKIMDESNKQNTNKVAVINVNDKQFDKKYFNYKTE